MVISRADDDSGRTAIHRRSSGQTRSVLCSSIAPHRLLELAVVQVVPGRLGGPALETAYLREGIAAARQQSYVRSHGPRPPYDRVSRVRWKRMDAGGEKAWFARKAQELVDTQGIQRATQQVPRLPR